jgi:hypothetical protein
MEKYPTKGKLRKYYIFFCILVLLGCERVYVKTYPEKGGPSTSSPKEPSPTMPSPTEFPRERPPSRVEPLPSKTYAETVSQWKSYQDLAKWFEKEFILDVERFKRFEQTLPPPRSSEETFRLKSGIYIDAATFARETLNRIDPSYKAQIVIIIFRPYGYNHYVCSFKKDGRILIMDYGTPHAAMSGVHGPFNSLEEYRKFYEKNHPIKRHIEAVRFLQ